jgi:seryl-tRNA synthetase
VIDIKLVRSQPDMIRELCHRRGSDVDVDELIEADRKLRESDAEADKLRSERKKLRGPESRERATEIKNELKDLDEASRELKAKRDDLWARLPNLLAPDVPDGKDDSDNVELSRWGEQPGFSFEPKTHEVIGADLDILDLERGANVAGSGFYYWKGDGARMVNAIFDLALRVLDQRGFVQMYTPVVARERTLFGTGYLPFSDDQIYNVENEDLALIGTSEQTLVGYHVDEIIPANDLPLLYTSYTPCFRTEAGAYGRAVRGAFRVHQFHKVEQIVFCEPEESEKWHKECLKNEEDIMQLLNLPYRVVNVCIGDMGAPGYKKYDVEGWFAGYGDYRETHSNTNLLDYQTRRLNIRCKGEGPNFHPNTISATMITDRAVLAIMENNQLEDGSFVIPEILRPHMGGQERICRK